MQLSAAYIKEKWQHAGFQKYLRNTGWMFFGRFFALGVSFFVGAYIARYLGPANYGLMNYVISFVGLFGFLASFGIDGIVSREIIRQPEEKSSLLGTSFYLKVVGAILAIIMTNGVAWFITDDLFTLILIGLFSLNFIPQTFNIIEIYFQSQVLSVYITRLQIFTTFIVTLLKFIAIYLGQGIFWIILIYTIETFLNALFLGVLFKKHGHKFSEWNFSKQIAKSILKDSWPLLCSSMAIGIYMKIDQIIIKNLLDDTQVGLYAAAVRLSEIWYFIPVVLCTSLFPTIAKKMDADLFSARIKKIYSLLFVIAFTISIFVTLFSEKIITFVFGTNYSSATPVLQIYIWTSIAVFWGLLIEKQFIIKSITHIYAIVTIIGMLINIILNLILIPHIGIIGAALASLCSYSLTTLILMIFPNLYKNVNLNERPLVQ